jgi:hypothetical protein
MTYQLNFIKTTDGYLRITASAKGTSSLVAIDLDPDVLAAAARMAKVSKRDAYDLNWSAKRAWNNERLVVCCEAMELSSEQLKQLGFNDDWLKLA